MVEVSFTIWSLCLSVASKCDLGDLGPAELCGDACKDTQGKVIHESLLMQINWHTSELIF